MRAVVLALLLGALPAAGQERVLEFHSNVRIGADGALTVTETIAVQAEGREIRRGILRDFPTDYRGRFGEKVRVPFTVLLVTRSGNAEPWTTQRLSNGVRVRIGNPALQLPHGRHVYEIMYRTSRQLGFFEDHDELYWNVNGNGWTFAMDQVSADVHLPAAALQTSQSVEQRSADRHAGPGGGVLTARGAGPGSVTGRRFSRWPMRTVRCTTWKTCWAGRSWSGWQAASSSSVTTT